MENMGKFSIQKKNTEKSRQITARVEIFISKIEHLINQQFRTPPQRQVESNHASNLLNFYYCSVIEVTTLVWLIHNMQKLKKS